MLSANDDISIIEKELGFPNGYFSDGRGLVRIDVDDVIGLNLRLDEETVGDLDFDEFAKVDITVTPSNWEVNGSTGIKAYVKTMYVTLVQDELSAIYDEDDEELPFN